MAVSAWFADLRAARASVRQPAARNKDIALQQKTRKRSERQSGQRKSEEGICTAGEVEDEKRQHVEQLLMRKGAASNVCTCFGSNLLEVFLRCLLHCQCQPLAPVACSTFSLAAEV